MHKIGLTTQIPNQRIIATNKADKCARVDKKLELTICPPKTKIDSKNKQYLKVLDILDAVDKVPIDVENPYKIIGEYIQKMELKYDRLLGLANNSYNKDTILQLAHVAGDKL